MSGVDNLKANQSTRWQVIFLILHLQQVFTPNFLSNISASWLCYELTSPRVDRLLVGLSVHCCIREFNNNSVVHYYRSVPFSWVTKYSNGVNRFRSSSSSKWATVFALFLHAAAASSIFWNSGFWDRDFFSLSATTNRNMFICRCTRCTQKYIHKKSCHIQEPHQDPMFPIFYSDRNYS